MTSMWSESKAETRYAFLFLLLFTFGLSLRRRRREKEEKKVAEWKNISTMSSACAVYDFPFGFFSRRPIQGRGRRQKGGEERESNY